MVGHVGLELREECRVRNRMLKVIRITMIIEVTEVDMISQGSCMLLIEVRKHCINTKERFSEGGI